MTTRHEFLEQLHELLHPKVYLEIGVQHGWSLQLSKAEINIAIDPEPLVTAGQMFERTGVPVKMTRDTSDIYFGEPEFIEMDLEGNKIDLAFIDGMHLAEFAWRDFVNVAKYCHAGSVVVFDDVLPTTQEMAAREQCPGDWTGDVWKVFYELKDYNDLVLALVDTTPTGTLVVTGFDDYWKSAGRVDGNPFMHDVPPPADVLDRRHAWSAPAVLDNLKDRGFGA